MNFNLQYLLTKKHLLQWKCKNVYCNGNVRIMILLTPPQYKVNNVYLTSPFLSFVLTSALSSLTVSLPLMLPPLSPLLVSFPCFSPLSLHLPRTSFHVLSITYPVFLASSSSSIQTFQDSCPSFPSSQPLLFPFR